MDWNAPKICINTVILCSVPHYDPRTSPLDFVGNPLTLLMLVLNAGEILVSVQRALVPFLKSIKPKKKENHKTNATSRKSFL